MDCVGENYHKLLETTELQNIIRNPRSSIDYARLFVSHHHDKYSSDGSKVYLCATKHVVPDLIFMTTIQDWLRLTLKWVHGSASNYHCTHDLLCAYRGIEKYLGKEKHIKALLQTVKYLFNLNQANVTC